MSALRLNEGSDAGRSLRPLGYEQGLEQRKRGLEDGEIGAPDRIGAHRYCREKVMAAIARMPECVPTVGFVRMVVRGRVTGVCARVHNRTVPVLMTEANERGDRCSHALKGHDEKQRNQQVLF